MSNLGQLCLPKFHQTFVQMCSLQITKLTVFGCQMATFKAKVMLLETLATCSFQCTQIRVWMQVQLVMQRLQISLAKWPSQVVKKLNSIKSIKNKKWACYLFIYLFIFLIVDPNSGFTQLACQSTCQDLVTNCGTCASFCQSIMKIWVSNWIP